jgi:hypothetical protein
VGVYWKSNNDPEPTVNNTVSLRFSLSWLWQRVLRPYPCSKRSQLLDFVSDLQVSALRGYKCAQFRTCLAMVPSIASMRESEWMLVCMRSVGDNWREDASGNAHPCTEYCVNSWFIWIQENLVLGEDSIHFVWRIPWWPHAGQPLTEVSRVIVSWRHGMEHCHMHRLFPSRPIFDWLIADRVFRRIHSPWRSWWEEASTTMVRLPNCFLSLL